MQGEKEGPWTLLKERDVKKSLEATSAETTTERKDLEKKETPPKGSSVKTFANTLKLKIGFL